jgi:catalase
MKPEDRTALVNNIVGHLGAVDGPKRDEIINRQLCHFFRANIELGMRVAQGLGVNIDANALNHSK